MFALWYLYYGYEEFKRLDEENQTRNVSGQSPQTPTPVLFQKVPSTPTPSTKPEVKSPQPNEVGPVTPTPPEPKRQVIPTPTPTPIQPSLRAQPPPPAQPSPPTQPTVPAQPPPPAQPPVPAQQILPPQPKPQPPKPIEVPRPKPSQAPEDRLMKLETKPEPPPWQPFPNAEDRMMNPALYQRRTPKMVDAATLEKLESGFKKLAASDSKSLLKKYLTQEVFDKLKTLKTPTFGSSLLDVIQSGLENHDSGVGIYAPDAEAYTTFADLFDPIIEDYHGGFKKTDKHPAKDWGDVDTFTNLDPAGEYIISTRVRCGRSMEGYPFNPCLTEAQYKEMEGKVSSTLSGLEGELKGAFYPLTGMTKEVQQKLIDDHFLFKEGDRFLQAANACRYWPSGRGIYHNDNKTFLVWCNEEDHLRLISMQMGGDLGQVYRRLVSAVNDIEKRVPFSHNDRLGFLTFCPTNLGTTIRASVHIKVPKLAANRAKLEEVAGKFNLQVRGTRGEHTEAEGGVYDISNKRRMGLTEYQAVKEMNDGIAELIKIEREL